MPLSDIYKGYNKATGGLEALGASERDRIMREYDAMRDTLQRQVGTTERDAQRILGEIRTAERKEQRRRDLPGGKARDLGTTTQLADIRKQAENIQRDIRNMQTKVSQARGESLADLQQQIETERARLSALRNTVKEAKESTFVGSKWEKGTSSNGDSGGFSASDIEWIESHGGKVGVVSDAEARQLESDWEKAKGKSIPAYDDTAEFYRSIGIKPVVSSSLAEAVKTATANAIASGAEITPVGTGIPTSSVVPSGKATARAKTARAFLLPFKDGNGYDLVSAIDYNIPIRLLQNAGFNDKQIVAAIHVSATQAGTLQARKITSLISPTPAVSAPEPAPASTAPRDTFKDIEDYKEGTGYRLADALLDGATRKELQDAGFENADISKAIKQNTAARKLEKYRTEDGYDLGAALQAGVSRSTLRDAGFSDKAIDKAADAAANIASSTKQLEPYKTGKGYDLLGAVRDGISRATLNDAGFEKKDIDWAFDALAESKRTNVALPGEKNWYNLRTGKTITDTEYKKLTSNGINSKADDYTRATPEVRRGAVVAASTLFFSPARAGLPEVKKEDITGMDWAVGGAQAALWAFPFMPKVAQPFVQGAAASIFGVQTASNWERMSQNQRLLSVGITAAIALPLIHGTIKPSFKPIKVPLKGGGEVTVWSGFSTRGKPIVGISRAKPNISNVAESWRPVTKLETTVLGTEKALQQMGVAQAEIDKVLRTVKSTKSFKGKRSPYEPSTVKASDVTPQALNAEELSIVLKNLVKVKKNVAQVYGSTTIKPQLEPGLREWRPLGDIEAQLQKMTPNEAAALARKIVTELNKKSPNKFSISPEDPLRIMTRGHHAVELKLAGVDDLAAIEKAGTSISSSTGTTSWGMTVAESPIEVTYSGVGRLKIMRLSESGVRKMDTITRLGKGGEFAPPAHRLKDIADYYVILRTFKGEKVANAWAEIYGYKVSDLLKAATKNPLDLGAWSLDLNSAPGSAAPQISIALPPNAAKLIKAKNPELYRTITKPITSRSPIPSSAPARIGSAGLLPSARLRSNASASPLPSAKSIPGTSVKLTSTTPTSASPSASLKSAITSPSLGISPSPSLSPSLGLGGGKGSGGSFDTIPIPTTHPSSYPVPIPSTTPLFPPEKSPRPPHKLPLPGGEELSLTDREYIGIVAWRQGLFYIMVYPPYTKAQTVYTRKPIPGVAYASGPQSPQRSAVVVGGKLPRSFSLAMGITKVRVSPGGGRKAPQLEFSERKIARPTTPELGEVRSRKRKRK